MTGYGTAAAQTEALKAAVTVRSLNHRYLDVSVHVSRRLQALETDIKRVVQERISRGRVELAVQAAFTRDEEGVVVAPRPIVGGLVRALREIKAEHALAGEVAIADVARFPGALEVVESPDSLDDERRQELLAVVSQALLPKAEGGGVCAAFEIMIMTSAIEHLVRENQTHKITSAIQTGAQQGMILLDDFLYNLFLQKKITYQVMMGSAQNPADLEQKIKDFTYANQQKK